MWRIRSLNTWKYWTDKYTKNIVYTIYIYIFLTRHEGRTGKISARGLDSTKKTTGQYPPSPEQVWLIRKLLIEQKFHINLSEIFIYSDERRILKQFKIRKLYLFCGNVILTLDPYRSWTYWPLRYQNSHWKTHFWVTEPVFLALSPEIWLTVAKIGSITSRCSGKWAHAHP